MPLRPPLLHPWRFAKTYPDAPHEYILKEWDPVTYGYYENLINEHGVVESFTLSGRTAKYRYYYEGGYRYWMMNPVLNRCKCTPDPDAQQVLK